MVDSKDSRALTESLVSIAEDNEYFKRMLSLIPPTGLQDQTDEREPSEDEEENLKSAAKKRKNDKKKKKQQKKNRKKENAVVTENNVTVVQKQSTKHNRNEDTNFTEVKHKKPKLDHPTESVSEHPTESVSEHDKTPASIESPSKIHINSAPKHNIPVKQKPNHGASKQSVKKQSKPISNEKSNVTKSIPGPSASSTVLSSDLPEGDTLLTASITSIEDKRAKLRAKIDELQAKRKPSNREILDKKKLKRQESKMKLKQKRKLEKIQNKQNKQNGQGSKPDTGNMNKSATPAKPVFNKEGQMVFSKFDFTDSAKKEKKHSNLGGKDYKRLLEKIEKRNEKINKVKSKDESAGKALEDKFKWQSVLHKAEGEKVKDNPEMLKRAMKRKQKMKDQKQTKWDSRTEHVGKLKDDRQKKRNENIQKRKQANKDKKMKKLKKKGRMIPGF